MAVPRLTESNRSGRSSLKTLKYKNRHAVLQYLRRNENASVAEIAKQTSLSKMTVHNIMEHYLETGLIQEAGKGDSTDEGGKKPKLFAFNPDFRFIFSVRIVEQSLSSALTNLNGEISASHTAFHGQDTGLEDILRIVRESFITLTKRRKVAPEQCLGAVVGSHGIIDVERGICVISPHFVSWGKDVPMRDLIAKELPPGIPVYIDNWMRYHAYGELKVRQDGVNRFFLIGTEYDGLAGGLVADGKLQHGNLCLSGEIGHMVVDPDNQTLCACGGKGCLEVMVSPRRLEDKARELRGEYPDSLLFTEKPNRDVSFDAILKASNQGDALACRLIDQAVTYFAIAINNLVYSCDPGLFIIQGEYAKAGDYFIANLRNRVNNLTLLRMKKTIDIEYSTLDDEYSVIGAACYVADMHFESMSAFG